MSRPYTWTATTISDMVKKLEYMGHTVNFRTHKDSYKDKHSRKVNPEDWILFKNTGTQNTQREISAYEEDNTRIDKFVKLPNRQKMGQPHRMSRKYLYDREA